MKYIRTKLNFVGIQDMERRKNFTDPRKPVCWWLGFLKFACAQNVKIWYFQLKEL